MKPIFGRGPALQLRLFLAVIISAGLMLADNRLDTFSNITNKEDNATNSDGVILTGIQGNITNYGHYIHSQNTFNNLGLITNKSTGRTQERAKLHSANNWSNKNNKKTHQRRIH